MAVPWTLVFVSLLVAYVISSEWSGLDSRYPIVLGLCVLLISAGFDAAGRPTTANILTEYAVLFLAAGVLLLIIDHFRDPDLLRELGKPTSNSPRAEGERQGSWDGR